MAKNIELMNFYECDNNLRFGFGAVSSSISSSIAILTLVECLLHHVSLWRESSGGGGVIKDTDMDTTPDINQSRRPKWR